MGFIRCLILNEFTWRFIGLFMIMRFHSYPDPHFCCAQLSVKCVTGKHKVDTIDFIFMLCPQMKTINAMYVRGLLGC